jgi:hypothetical protein
MLLPERQIYRLLLLSLSAVAPMHPPAYHWTAKAAKPIWQSLMAVDADNPAACCLL